MSDIDDDLLALAGGDIEEEEEQEQILSSRKRKHTGDYEDEDEEDSGDEDEEEAQVTDSDEDMTDDEIPNPYPLEGKYKNEKDRTYLEGLAEIERESILFDRSQEMQKFNERKYLARRARQQNKEKTSLSSRKSARATATSARSEKRAKLAQLKQRRDKLAKRAAAREAGGLSDEESEAAFTDEEDVDEEYGLGHGSEEDEDQVKWAASEPKAPKELNVELINRVKVGRAFLAHFCHYPQFAEVIEGCFVRVNIGFNREKQVNIYRLCEVQRVQKSKLYSFMGRAVDECLVVSHGQSERVFEMGFCSDSPVTSDEFDFWKSTLEKADLSLPSVRRLEHKAEELRSLKKHQLTPAEVNDMIARRQELAGSGGANSVLEKLSLQQQRTAALEEGDQEKIQAIDRKIEAIDRGLSKLQQRHDTDKLAKVNERNRKANLDEIRKAELAAKKAALSLSEKTANPFSRLRTNARIFYGSKSSSPAAADELAAEMKKDATALDVSIDKKEADAILSSKRHSEKKQTLDDIIAKLEIPLELS